jgi:hypothetical protein
MFRAVLDAVKMIAITSSPLARRRSAHGHLLTAFQSGGTGGVSRRSNLAAHKRALAFIAEHSL